jgi:uncharacterized integral membrane protein
MRLARRLLGIAIFVALLVAGWSFAQGNSDTVTIDYVVGEVAGVSVWAALFAAFLVGAGCAGALAAYQIAKLGMVTRRYRKAVRGLEAEVHQLRNLPLAAEEPDLELTSSEPAPLGGALGRGA